MKKITVSGLNVVAPMPQMLRERSESIRANARRQGRTSAQCYEVDFPVKGGWGYSQEDACVFDFGDEYSEFPADIRRSMLESSSISLEKLFFERRVYEEIIFHPLPSTPSLHCLRWEMNLQKLCGIDDKKYDLLHFQVKGFYEDDLNFLKADYERCMERNDKEGIERNLKMAEERVVAYDTVCWFDISCYWGME